MNPWGRPFSRSYGSNLPSSLTSLHSSAFGYSPRLPVSVCGTVPSLLLRGFSWHHEISSFSPYGPALRLTVKHLRICLETPASRVSNHIVMCGPAYPYASPHRQTKCWEVRNINRISIAYAFRPQLRYRLTLSGLTFLRKP